VVRARSVSFGWTDQVLRIDDELPELPAEPARVHIEIEPIPVLVMGLSRPVQDVRKEDETEAAA
jgi:hypothetical protein